MKQKFFLFILLNIKYIISDSDVYKCSDIDAPLWDIETGTCVNTKFEASKHQISNEIIKTQWLNKNNQIGFHNNWYMGYDISTKGDLIIGSLQYYDSFADRYFYGIKSNGREFFYNEERSEFINHIKIISNTAVNKYESEFVRIKLATDDENDYYLFPSIFEHGVELVDLNKNEVYGISQTVLFGGDRVSSFNIVYLKFPQFQKHLCFVQ